MITTDELGQFPLFEDLSIAHLKTLIQLGEHRKYAKDEIIFREGDPASHLYFLLSGRVRLQVQLTSHREQVAVAVLSQFGQVVGWSGLVSPQSYTAEAVCLRDSEMLVMEGQKLMRALVHDQEMGFSVMCKISTVIGDRLRNLQNTVLKSM